MRHPRALIPIRSDARDAGCSSLPTNGTPRRLWNAVAREAKQGDELSTTICAPRIADRPRPLGDRITLSLAYAALAQRRAIPHTRRHRATHRWRSAYRRSRTTNRRLVTDVEVLQELLHRYTAIGRRDAIQPAFDAVLGIVDDVFPIETAEVERAKQIVLGTPRLSARDAIHLAVMERRGVQRILSFDAGFDGFPGTTRVSG